MKEQVKVTTDTQIVVNRLASILEENQISTFVKNNVESAKAGGFGVPPNSVDLYIYESDVEKAKSIVEAFQRENKS